MLIVTIIRAGLFWSLMPVTAELSFHGVVLPLYCPRTTGLAASMKEGVWNRLAVMWMMVI
jgi:hypothetical protein